MSLRHVWLVALKDLRLFITDRIALAAFVAFPFLFVVMFNFVLSGVGTEDTRLELHLVTREASGLSHQIIGSMETKDDSQLQPGAPKIIWDKDYDTVLKAVEEKEMSGFLVFPEDFSAAVMMGYGADIEVVTNPDATYTRAALNGLARGIASRLGAQAVVRDAAVGLLMEQAIASGNTGNIAAEIEKIFSVQGDTASSESLVMTAVENIGEVQKENPSNYVIPGYLVMFVFFLAAQQAETIVRERQNGTLERLLSTSVKRGSILGGTYLGIAAKGLIQILVFWIAGILVFQIDLGASPAGVILLSILMVLMSAAFALMLATLARTERSAGSIGVIASLALAPLGGCWWPLFITPQWMQNMAKITPHAWANTGFNKLMVFGADFIAAVPEMLALVAFAVVFIIIAVMRFRTSD